MRLIIAGSRKFKDYTFLKQKVEYYTQNIQVTEVVSGKQKTPIYQNGVIIGYYGADYLGEQWAKENGIPVKAFPANWDKFGKRGAYIRNKEMAEYGDLAIIIKVQGAGNIGSTMMEGLAIKYLGKEKVKTLNYKQ